MVSDSMLDYQIPDETSNSVSVPLYEDRVLEKWTFKGIADDSWREYELSRRPRNSNSIVMQNIYQDYYYNNILFVYVYGKYSTRYSQDVIQYSGNVGISIEDIDEIVDFTKSIFYEYRKLDLSLEIDPEIENQERIVLNVLIDMEIEHALELEESWHLNFVTDFDKLIIQHFCLNVEFVE